MKLPIGQYTKHFDDHEITRRDDMSIFLKRPDEGFFWVTISTTDGGQLIVAGDVGPMVFAYGPKGLLSKISWIGGTEDVGYYVAQKASIGMTPFDVYRYSEDAWEEDVRKMFNDLPKNFGDEGDAVHDRLKKELTWDKYLDSEHVDHYLIDGIRDSNVQVWGELEKFLNSHGIDDCNEVIGDAGKVLDDQVVLCWAAVRKAYQLLQADGAYDTGDGK